MLKDVDLGLKTSDFKDLVAQKAKTASNLPLPFKTFAYDCFKVGEARTQPRPLSQFGFTVFFRSRENQRKDK